MSRGTAGIASCSPTAAGCGRSCRHRRAGRSPASGPSRRRSSNSAVGRRSRWDPGGRELRRLAVRVAVSRGRSCCVTVPPPRRSPRGVCPRATCRHRCNEPTSERWGRGVCSVRVSMRTEQVDGGRLWEVEEADRFRRRSRGVKNLAIRSRAPLYSASPDRDGPENEPGG